MQTALGDYKSLKLQLDGIVPPGHGFHRNLLLDTLYASLPRDPQVKVQIYNAEIVPGGYTNWSRQRPANAMPSQSPNSTGAITRTRSYLTCAWASA